MFTSSPALRSPLLAAAARARSRPDDVPVTPQERDSVLSQLAASAGGTVSRLADFLSIPGDYTRGVLAGRPGERVDSGELLRSLNLIGQEDNWQNLVGRMAADLATDPLSFVTGPSASLTRAGRAAKKLGWLEDAGRIASKKAIVSGALNTEEGLATLPRVAQLAHRDLKATGRTISTMDPALHARPLFGKRTALRGTTLDDYITYADDAKAAKQAALDVLGEEGLNELRNQPLAKSFGLAPSPFSDPLITGDLLGTGFGDKYADFLDTAAATARWSTPGRYAAALFDHRVGGATEVEDQFLRAADYARRKAAGATAKGANTYITSALNSAEGEDVFTEQGNRVMGRVLENTATPEDVAWMEAHPVAQQYVDYARSNLQEALERRRALGMQARELRDPYGLGYLPRQKDLALAFSGDDARMTRAINTFTNYDIKRKDALRIPGGRDTIMDLSRDPRFVGPDALPEDEAIRTLMGELNAINPGGPAVGRKKARALASLLRDLPLDVTRESPLFGQHPVASVNTYLERTAEAMASHEGMLDAMATHVVRNPTVTDEATGAISLGMPRPGGKNISVKEAIKRMDMTPGAEAQMRDRISKLIGRSPDEVSLSSVAIPEEMVERLQKMVALPKSQGLAKELMSALDWYTQFWRGGILAWPARSVRDLYSGAVSNWLSGAYSADGVAFAHALSTKGEDAVADMIRNLPLARYQEADGVNHFLADLAQHGGLGNPPVTGLGSSLGGDTALANVAGAAPHRVTAASIFGELAPQWDRSWGQFGRDLMTFRSQLHPTAITKNPLLRAGEKANTLTDNINRISGFYTLLKKGYAPEAAGAIVTRAQIDYGSLSEFERTWLKGIFPWYAYQSRILKEVVGQLAERPGGRYAALLKASETAQEGEDAAASEEGGYIPSALRSQFAVAVPDMLGGQPSPGTRRFLTDLDLPGFDQINMFETPGTSTGAFLGTARQVGMQTHPIIRMGSEFAFGTDLFTNRPLGEGTSPLESVGQSLLGDRSFQVNPVVDKLAELVPMAGRPLYAARALLDPSGGDFSSRAAKTAVNAFTGVKLRDVTPEYRLADAGREIERSIAPFTRDFTQTFIPEEMIPHVPQWANRRLAVMRKLQEEKKVLKDRRQGVLNNQMD